MANKTQKNLRRAVSRASKRKQDVVEHKHPIRDYHSSPLALASCFVTQQIPTAVRNPKNGINSANQRRNTAQVVLVNENADGSKYSVTRHEPLDPSRPVRHKNHDYLKGSYRQSARVAA